MQQYLPATNMLAQLRYSQTLTEIGAEQNSTVVFPMPIDILRPFMEILDRSEKASVLNGVAHGNDIELPGPCRHDPNELKWPADRRMLCKTDRERREDFDRNWTQSPYESPSFLFDLGLTPVRRDSVDAPSGYEFERREGRLRPVPCGARSGTNISTALELMRAMVVVGL